MKDNFSTHSDKYARYRPTYPDEVFDFILSNTKGRHVAWDCATGNGQVAGKLVDYFDKIYASDISEQQLGHAFQHEKIIYSLQPAEKTNYPDKFFDLIVVAQAIHWFDFDRFYTEAKRTLKDSGILVVLGYGNVYIAPEVDDVIEKFYNDVVGAYWDKERGYIDEKYTTIPFPFNELKVPQFVNRFDWSFDHFLGYLNTWSAVKHFIKKNGYNPLDEVFEALKNSWGDKPTRQVNYPLLLRVGKL